MKWSLLAAEQGYAAAQYNLAVGYTKGEGIEKNNQEAIKVVATDSLGNTYEESTITEGTDHSVAARPS